MNQQQRQTNLDLICDKVIQTKMDVCRVKDGLQAVLKDFNDNLQTPTYLVNLMKKRIQVLESALEESEKEIQMLKQEQHKVKEKSIA